MNNYILTEPNLKIMHWQKAAYSHRRLLKLHSQGKISGKGMFSKVRDGGSVKF